MIIETKFNYYDRVVTPDRPLISMQVVKIAIIGTSPYYPTVSYQCQEIDTGKMHLIYEKNLQPCTRVSYI